VHEGAGAVDRIDDEDAILAHPRRIVLALLRQPAVAGARAAQHVVQDVVGGVVGGRDRRGALVLPPDLDVVAEEFQRLVAGRKSRLDQQVEIGGGVPERALCDVGHPRLRQRPASVMFSISKVGDAVE
jgi:hypothetical protein